VEILTADKPDGIISLLNFKDSVAANTKDPLLGKHLMYIHVLGQLEARALKENDSTSINNFFYSRYYWFVQFKERYYALYGHDEGLEQQKFKMINDYNEKFPEKVDWDVIEHIENHSI
jgi:hypothetical protein